METYVLYSLIANKVLKKNYGYTNKRYIITCKDFNEATEVASDIYSYDGVSHIKIANKRPKTRHLIEATKDNVFPA